MRGPQHRLAEPFRLLFFSFSYPYSVGQLTDGTRSRLSGPISLFPDVARPPCGRRVRERVRERVPLRCERVRSAIANRWIDRDGENCQSEEAVGLAARRSFVIAPWALPAHRVGGV